MGRVQQWQRVKEIVGSALERQPAIAVPFWTRSVRRTRNFARKSNHCSRHTAILLICREIPGWWKPRNTRPDPKSSGPIVC
jgi:hypothetical protein